MWVGTYAQSSAGRRKKDLPVRRQRHKRLGTIHAFKPDIDAWLQSRRDVVDTLSRPGPRHRQWIVASATLAVLVTAAGLWLRFFGADDL
jgi:hypothetical protein